MSRRVVILGQRSDVPSHCRKRRAVPFPALPWSSAVETVFRPHPVLNMLICFGPPTVPRWTGEIGPIVSGLSFRFPYACSIQAPVRSDRPVTTALRPAATTHWRPQLSVVHAVTGYRKPVTPPFSGSPCGPIVQALAHQRAPRRRRSSHVPSRLRAKGDRGPVPWSGKLCSASLALPRPSMRFRSGNGGRPHGIVGRGGQFPSNAANLQRSRFLRRRALIMTETELKVIAALAIIGLSRSPNKGYRIPAAIGTPSTL